MPRATAKSARLSEAAFRAPASFVNEGKLELLNTAGKLVLIDLREIKGVFFVREFNDSESLSRKTFAGRPRSEGLWVRLKFHDNDVIEGMMPNDLSQLSGDGFFVNPPDTRANTQRIFVPKLALESLTVLAVIGLAVSAALWWTYFGDGDDERAEQAMAATDPDRRAGLALATYYAHIPILLGVVTLAAGTALTIGTAAQPQPGGRAVAVAGGAALFLAGSAWFRWALQIGPIALRLAGAGFALATAALGVAVSVEVQGAVLLAGLVAMLAAERRTSARHRAAAGG